MDEQSDNSSSNIALYLTPEHDCSYLPGQLSRTLFIDPNAPPDPTFYQYLLQNGFRRSGDHVYRPHCADCQACVPLRLPVDKFQPRRNQRRCWRNNVDRIQVERRTARFDQTHFELYLRYTGTRHREGGMADADAKQYREFLTTNWCRSEFVEFRRKDQLIGVAVTDVLPQALSAVYTFFDPDYSELSPGTYAILWQIEEARRRGLRHLYLGYWIGACNKMNYKDRFRPLEAWDGRRWRRYESGDDLNGLYER